MVAASVGAPVDPKMDFKDLIEMINKNTAAQEEQIKKMERQRQELGMAPLIIQEQEPNELELLLQRWELPSQEPEGVELPSREPEEVESLLLEQPTVQVSPALPREVPSPAAVLRARGGGAAVPRARGGGAAAPRASGGGAAVPRARGGGAAVPRARGGGAAVPRARGGGAAVPRARGGGAAVPRARGGGVPASRTTNRATRIVHLVELTVPRDDAVDEVYERKTLRQCRITETHIKRTYVTEVQVTHLANMVGLLTAYLDGILKTAPLPEPVASELRLVSGTLLQISGFQGQALGRSLAGLIVAQRQLWLSQARVPDMDKSALLNAPISPGHTFGPAGEEILQCSHKEREASRQVASMLPSHALARDRTRHWRPPVTQTVSFPIAPHSDQRYHLQSSAAANQNCQQRWGNAGHGTAAQQPTGRQPKHCPRHPPKQDQGP
ncbi:UNVERIFIED_CONTAM: hypothetical protein FKN15_001963 [Acipenser sinensis]